MKWFFSPNNLQLLLTSARWLCSRQRYACWCCTTELARKYINLAPWPNWKYCCRRWVIVLMERLGVLRSGNTNNGGREYWSHHEQSEISAAVGWWWCRLQSNLCCAYVRTTSGEGNEVSTTNPLALFLESSRWMCCCEHLNMLSCSTKKESRETLMLMPWTTCDSFWSWRMRYGSKNS